MVKSRVVGDPGPRPRLEAASPYLASRAPAKIQGKAHVVQRNEPVAEKLVLPYEVCQVGSAVAGARLAGAPRVERPKVPAVLRVLEVEAAPGGQGRAVAGKARWEYAVEHVYPQRYDLQD